MGVLTGLGTHSLLFRMGLHSNLIHPKCLLSSAPAL